MFDGRQLHAITTKPKVLYCRAAALVECYSASIGTCNRFESVADISSSHESLHGLTRADVARGLFSTKPLRQLKSLNDLEAVLVPECPRLTGGLRKRQNTEQPDTALIPKNYNVAVITHCDIEVLKAFVDVGWWSLVLLESNPWLVVGYDGSGNIILEDPRGGRHTNRKTESDFERLWLLPPRTQCMLIQLEHLDKYTVKRKLRGHLSTDKINKIHIRTPARTPAARKC